MNTRRSGKRKKNNKEILSVIYEDDYNPKTDMGTQTDDEDEEIYEPPPSDEDDEDVEDSEFENFEDDDIKILQKLKKKNSKVYKRFLKCKEIIKSREVPITEILSADISDDKMANLVEQYECLHQIQPCTEEYLSYRDIISRNYYKYTEKSLVQNSVNKKSQDIESDLIIFKRKINELKCSEYNRKVLEEKLDEFEDTPKGEEKSKYKKWISLALTLPFDKLTNHEYDLCEKIQEVGDFLNKKLYGMKNVKERILLFLNKKLRDGGSKGCSIALLGPPGVGKTSISKVLSQCLGLPFAQLSFGGVNSSDFLLGHEFTYVGSKPGEISRCLSRMGSKNGILFFDEFDKVSDKRDIMSSLLHITDFSQNNEFRDNYFPELTQDLSRCWFIYSMNNLPEDPAMVDRLEVIKVDGYSIEDRKAMAREYLVPKYVDELKISNEIVITEGAIDKIVIFSGDGKSGVRDLERYISLVIEKAFFFVCNRCGTYDFKWYKKMIDNYRGGKIHITEDLIDIILKENKPEERYVSMYM